MQLMSYYTQFVALKAKRGFLDINEQNFIHID